MRLAGAYNTAAKGEREECARPTRVPEERVQGSGGATTRFRRHDRLAIAAIARFTFTDLRDSNISVVNAAARPGR